MVRNESFEIKQYKEAPKTTNTPTCLKWKTYSWAMTRHLVIQMMKSSKWVHPGHPLLVSNPFRISFQHRPIPWSNDFPLFECTLNISRLNFLHTVVFQRPLRRKLLAQHLHHHRHQLQQLHQLLHRHLPPHQAKEGNRIKWRGSRVCTVLNPESNILQHHRSLRRHRVEQRLHPW